MKGPAFYENLLKAIVWVTVGRAEGPTTREARLVCKVSISPASDVVGWGSLPGPPMAIQRDSHCASGEL